MSIAFQTPTRLPSGAPSPASVFLHSTWRSAGTWIWNEFRRNPATMAFCEPLHEELATMTLERIAGWNTESWESGHSKTAPYFLEYAPLVRKARKGVAGFHRSFAFDRFFMRPGDTDDRLREYLERLHNLAYSEGRLPVFKFCRSLGRAGWMRREFPNATHVGLIRDPLTQWESCRRLADRGTPYFLATPVALLALNLREPLVAAVNEALDVRLDHVRGRDVRATIKRAEAFVAQATPLMTYQTFLAFWVATSVASLPYMDTIVDSDCLSDSSSYRDTAKVLFHEKTGIEIDFGSAKASSITAPLLDVADVKALHEHAWAVAHSFGVLPILDEKLRAALNRYTGALTR